jgi:hypothetical protein
MTTTHPITLEIIIVVVDKDDDSDDIDDDGGGVDVIVCKDVFVCETVFDDDDEESVVPVLLLLLLLLLLEPSCENGMLVFVSHEYCFQSSIVNELQSSLDETDIRTPPNVCNSIRLALFT